MRILLFFMAFFLISCSDSDEKELKLPPNNATIPDDVPIAKPDPKINISKNPPAPEAE